MISVSLVVYVCCYYVSCCVLGCLHVLLAMLACDLEWCGGLFAVAWFVGCRLVGGFAVPPLGLCCCVLMFTGGLVV